MLIHEHVHMAQYNCQ